MSIHVEGGRDESVLWQGLTIVETGQSNGKGSLAVRSYKAKYNMKRGSELEFSACLKHD